jgi:OOP family OmpA-OmpF porin
VIGYADTVGSADLNMQLSQRRANVVRDALVAAGVPAAAITTTASGETSLLVDTGPQTNQPKNRRVVIVIN